MATELYTLLKVKSRQGLSFLEWLWLNLHKEPSRGESDKVLDRLWLGKFIEEEPWETDEQGRELIRSLPDKRFVLTSLGKKRLRKEKWAYLWMKMGKVVWCLIWIVRKLWWLIAAAVVGELVRSLFPNLLQGV
jgi:hypothetical protein